MTVPFPAVPATPPLRFRDVPGVAVWMLRGYAYGVRRSPGLRSRAYATGVLGLYLFIVVAYPPVLAWLICLPRRGSAFPGGFLVLTVVLMVLTATALASNVVYGRGRRAYMPATR